MDDLFDKPVDRRDTDSIKWDSAGADVLPMWIADMDFKTAPAIQEALERRVAHGIFGYTQTPARFYDAIAGWWSKRHGFTLQPDWLVPVPGVVPPCRPSSGRSPSPATRCWCSLRCTTTSLPASLMATVRSSRTTCSYVTVDMKLILTTWKPGQPTLP